MRQQAAPLEDRPSEHRAFAHIMCPVTPGGGAGRCSEARSHFEGKAKRRAVPLRLCSSRRSSPKAFGSVARPPSALVLLTALTLVTERVPWWSTEVPGLPARLGRQCVSCCRPVPGGAAPRCPAVGWAPAPGGRGADNTPTRVVASGRCRNRACGVGRGYPRLLIPPRPGCLVAGSGLGEHPACGCVFSGRARRHRPRGCHGRGRRRLVDGRVPSVCPRSPSALVSP